MYKLPAPLIHKKFSFSGCSYGTFRLHFRHSTASGILQIMLRDGLLVREPVEGDARLKRLVLTPIAQEQLSQMQQDLLRVENKATAALTKQELETLFTLLDKVRGSLAPGKEEPFID